MRHFRRLRSAAPANLGALGAERGAPLLLIHAPSCGSSARQCQSPADLGRICAHGHGDAAHFRAPAPHPLDLMAAVRTRAISRRTRSGSVMVGGATAGSRLGQHMIVVSMSFGRKERPPGLEVHARNDLAVPPHDAKRHAGLTVLRWLGDSDPDSTPRSRRHHGGAQPVPQPCPRLTSRSCLGTETPSLPPLTAGE